MALEIGPALVDVDLVAKLRLSFHLCFLQLSGLNACFREAKGRNMAKITWEWHISPVVPLFFRTRRFSTFRCFVIPGANRNQSMVNRGAYCSNTKASIIVASADITWFSGAGEAIMGIETAQTPN